MSKATNLISILNEEKSKILDISNSVYTEKQRFPKHNVPISPISDGANEILLYFKE